MKEKPTVGVSACLIGRSFRYNGQDVRNAFISNVLSRYMRLVPVCPEVEMGLPVPREPIKLIGKINNPCLIGDHSREDLTFRMQRWINAKLVELEKLTLFGFIFKKSSPSCGLYKVKVWHESGGGYLRMGKGLFARAFRERYPWLPAIQDDELNCFDRLDQFLERVFMTWRLEKVFANTFEENFYEFHQKSYCLFICRNPRMAEMLDEFLKTSKLDTYKKCVARLLAVPKNRRLTVYCLSCFLQGIAGIIDQKIFTELKNLIFRYEKGSVNFLEVREKFLSIFERDFVKEFENYYFFNPYPLTILINSKV